MQKAFERVKSSGYMTNWAARLFARAIDRKLKEIGVASGQMPVFFALGDGAALQQKKLAQIASIEQPTMAATLSRMERDGLIIRRPDPDDGRSQLVELTPAAMEKAALVKQAGMAVHARALEQLSDDERVLFLDMLGRVVSSLEGLLEEDPA